MGLVKRSRKLLSTPAHAMHRWQNRDLWLQLKTMWSPRLRVEWCPGHQGICGNEIADKLANQARDLHLAPTAWWRQELWRVFQNGNEIGASLSHVVLTTYPCLKWDDINIHLSFCNLRQYFSTTRLKWIWGRTSWIGTGPYWHRDSTLPCPFRNVCPHPTSHFTDLFSLIAECPAFHAIRDAMIQLWSQASGHVQLWFMAASRSDKRNFIRTLIPTTLVSELLKTFSHRQVRTLINHRDTHWQPLIIQKRQFYANHLQNSSTLTHQQPGHVNPPGHFPP
jgi:hypothetical protein